MSKNRLQAISNAEYVPDELVESAFIDFLASMGFSVEKLRECRAYFNGYEGGSCSCVYYRPIGCSVRDLCPKCQKSYLAVCASDTVECVKRAYAKAGYKFHALDFEFTVPQPLWNRITVDDFKEFRATGFKVLREVLGAGGKKRLAAIGANHWWHSSAPLKGWYPHLHFTVLDIVFDEETGLAEKIPYWLEEKTISTIRALWKERVQERYCYRDDSEWNIHYGYIKSFGALTHRLRYQYRGPIFDLYKSFVRGELRNVKPEDHAVWVHRMISLGGMKKVKTVQRYGWFSDNSLAKFMKKLGVENFQCRSKRIKEGRKIYCARHPGSLLRLMDGERRLSLAEIVKAGRITWILGYARNRNVDQQMSMVDDAGS